MSSKRPPAPVSTVSELPFAQIIENLGEGIIFCDRDDRVALTNRRMSEMSGYSADEMLGNLVYELLLPEPEYDLIRNRTKRRLAGLSDQYEILLQRRGGARFWALITATPFFGSDGSIIGSLGAITDITERKQAEGALRKSEERLRHIFEMPLVGIAITSPAKQWIDFNDKLCQLLGYEREELIDIPWTAITHEEDLNKDLVLYNETIAGQRDGYSLDKRFRRKNGTIMHSSMSVGAVRKADRSVDYLIAVIQDVSDWNKVQLELARQKDFLRLVIDSNPNLIFVKDRDFRFSLVNKAVADLYGTSASQLIGRADREFNPNAKEVDSFNSDDRRVIETGTPIFVPEEIVTDQRSGEQRWLQTIKKPLRGEDGAVTHLLGVATDITDRKKAEQEAIRLQRQLLQAQKMEAIGQLAAGIAHDLNNALAAVVGHLQLLKLRGRRDTPETLSVETALKGCERASSLVEQLLGFARQGKYHPQLTTLQQLVSDTLSFLGRIIGTDHTITVRPFSQDLQVDIDVAQLQQALTNLIINAKQAMPNGGAITFDFAVREVLSPRNMNPKAVPGKYAVLSVIDTGCGISTEHMDKIFEPFFTTKPVGQGTGLGLSTVYGILQNHCGWVEVQSEVGIGSMFSLVLPLASVSTPISDNKYKKATTASVGQGRIMVVDDEESISELMRQYLAHFGYQVHAFCDPQVALDWFRTHFSEIDLLILDMKMPLITGEAFFKEARAIDPNVAAVLMSGYSQDEAAQRLLASGALNYFSKPTKLDDLVSWINSFMGKRRKLNGE
ncbi:MAG: PAS domain S-box protein [Oligoflexia bacterium]|nr:PAS domain S-box protein [Oligoflexia bacterium]